MLLHTITKIIVEDRDLDEREVDMLTFSSDVHVLLIVMLLIERCKQTFLNTSNLLLKSLSAPVVGNRTYSLCV